MPNLLSPAARRAATALLLWPLAIPPGLAQVTVDPRALDELAPPKAAAPARKPASATKPASTAIDGPHQTPPPLGALPVPPAAKPATAKTGPAKPATTTMPAVAPPAPVLPPPIEVPTRPATPPPPTPVVADAPGQFGKIPGGLRITFGRERAELNPDTAAAIRTLAHAGGPGSDTTFSVTAYAAGAADDPSSARRLSLSRALAVRSALMGEGVPSVRIYVKALGANLPEASPVPADRVDITAAPPGLAAPAPPARPATSTPDKAAP